MQPLERAAYLAHASRPAFGRRLAAAAALIHGADGCAVSVSWGKDSVALLHLAACVRPDIVVLNARYPNPAERFADMDRVRDAVLSRPEFARVRYVEVHTPGEWEMYERAGGGFAEAVTPAQRAATSWWKAQFEANMGTAQQAAGCNGVILGLRADESHARRMNAITRGDDYVRADGMRVVLPLQRWSGADVWAYVASNDLPWLRIYDGATTGRELARSGFVFATGGAGAIRRHGVWEDWRRVYPQEFAAWMARFPELDR